MSHPVVTINNRASRNIFVDSDPNWDDQILLIDGKRIDGVYTLPQGATIRISIPWEGAASELMMGVIFANAAQYDYGDVGFYQLSIGQEPQSGHLGITDQYESGSSQLRYTIEHQTPWSMTVNFIDA